MPDDNPFLAPAQAPAQQSEPEPEYRPDPRLGPYAPIYEAAGKEYRLDPFLIRAHALQESEERPDAIGTSGEAGMMQIMPGTQSELGVEHPFSPYASIMGGAKYMRHLHDMFPSSPAAATSAYNSGPSGEYKPGYVSAVNERYRRLTGHDIGTQLEPSKGLEITPEDEVWRPRHRPPDAMRNASPPAAQGQDNPFLMPAPEQNPFLMPAPAPTPAPEEGYLATGAHAALRGAVESGKAVAGAFNPFVDTPLPEPAKDELGKLLQQPISEGGLNPKWYVAHFMHGLGAMAPTATVMGLGALAGGVIGGAVGSAAPVGGTTAGAVTGALVGTVGGGAVGSMLQEIKPAYQRARAEGLDHDAAVNRAWEETGIAGVIGAAMGYAPAISIFGREAVKTATGAVEQMLKRPVSEALAQIFGVQPALGAAQQEATGYVEGKQPTWEERAQAYVESAGAGALLTAAHHPGVVTGAALDAARRAAGRAVFGKGPGVELEHPGYDWTAADPWALKLPPPEGEAGAPPPAGGPGGAPPGGTPPGGAEPRAQRPTDMPKAPPGSPAEAMEKYMEGVPAFREGEEPATTETGVPGAIPLGPPAAVEEAKPKEKAAEPAKTEETGEVPAAPPGSRLLGRDWFVSAGMEGGKWVPDRAMAALRAEVDEALKQGHNVHIVTDGGERTWPIVGAHHGGLTDAEGRWHSPNSFLGDQTGLDGVRITPKEAPAAETAGSPENQFTPEKKQQALETAHSLQVGDVVSNPLMGGSFEIETRIERNGKVIGYVIMHDNGKRASIKTDEAAGMFLPQPYTDASGERKFESPSTIVRAKPAEPAAAKPVEPAPTPATPAPADVSAVPEPEAPGGLRTIEQIMAAENVGKQKATEIFGAELLNSGALDGKQLTEIMALYGATDERLGLSNAQAVRFQLEALARKGRPITEAERQSRKAGVQAAGPRVVPMPPPAAPTPVPSAPDEEEAAPAAPTEPPPKPNDPKDDALPPTAPAEEPVPGGQIMLPPKVIQRDPEEFQFKTSDEGGVTGRLSSETVFKPEFADAITVWQRNDGAFFVVNGHQRHDLALRAEALGQQNVMMPARVWREADGYTKEYMRALGAFQNLAQGSGTALDAARVLRALPSLPPHLTLPEPSSAEPVVKMGRALASLGDHAFKMVTNGLIEPEYAAEVGAKIADPDQQVAAIGALIKAEPANQTQARLMVQDIVDSGFEKAQEGAQGSWLDLIPAQTLLAERAKVLQKAKTNLNALKRTFAQVVKGEGALTEAGNVLQTEENKRRQAANERVLQALEINATKRGPLSDALTAAARELAAGKPLTQATAQFTVAANQLVAAGHVEGIPPGAGDGRGGPPTALEDRPTTALEQPKGRAPRPPTGGAPLFGEAPPATPARPGVIPTIRTDPRQQTMPGMGPSAVQAQAQRDQTGRGAIGPKGEVLPPDQGLFAKAEPPQPALPGVGAQPKPALVQWQDGPSGTNARADFGNRIAAVSASGGQGWRWAVNDKAQSRLIGTGLEPTKAAAQIAAEKLATQQGPRPVSQFPMRLDQIADVPPYTPESVHIVAGEWILSEGRRTQLEHLAIVDSTTGKVITAGSSMNNGSVTVPSEAQLAAAGFAPRSLVLHHNHPSGFALSASDFRVLANNNRIGYVVAEGNTGEVYIASLTQEFLTAAGKLSQLERQDLMDSLFKSAHLFALDEIVPLIDKGVITKAEGDAGMNDLIGRALDHAGAIHYVSTYELPKPIADAFRAHVGTTDVNDRRANSVSPAEALAGLPHPVGRVAGGADQSRLAAGPEGRAGVPGVAAGQGQPGLPEARPIQTSKGQLRLFDRPVEARDPRVPLYSAVERGVEKLPQAKGTGEQMLVMLSKQPGVKAEELKWLGLPEWLHGQKTVTREQIADYVRANSLEVREVTYGAGGGGAGEDPHIQELRARTGETHAALVDARGNEEISRREMQRRRFELFELTGDSDISSRLLSGQMAVDDLPAAHRTAGMMLVRQNHRVEEATNQHTAAFRTHDNAQRELEEALEPGARQIAGLEEALEQARADHARIAAQLEEAKGEFAHYARIITDETGSNNALGRLRAGQITPADLPNVRFAAEQFLMADEIIDTLTEQLHAAMEAAHAAEEALLDAQEQGRTDENAEPQYQTYALKGGTQYGEKIFTLPPKPIKVSVGEPTPYGGTGQRLSSETQQIDTGVTERTLTVGGEVVGKVTYIPGGLNALGRPVHDLFLTDIQSRPGGRSWQNHSSSIEDAVAWAERRLTQHRGRGDIYTHNHWSGVENPVAHVRYSIYTTPDGKRWLVLHESQSDWHQAGRKRGYVSEVAAEKAQLAELEKQYSAAYKLRNRAIAENEGRLLSEQDEEAGAIHQRQLDALDAQMQPLIDRQNERLRHGATVPDAPFKTSWPMLVMKRMIKYAVDNGLDGVAWAPGEVQVARYRDALQKRVDKIEWEKTDKGIHLVGSKDGRRVLDTHQKETELSDAIGKSMAEKIIGDPNQAGTISGRDITVSDTGMAGFYDRILPAETNKLLKNYGVKVGRSEIPIGKHTRDETRPDAQAKADHGGEWDRLVAESNRLGASISAIQMRLYELRANGIEANLAEAVRLHGTAKQLRLQHRDITSQMDVVHDRMVDETMARDTGTQPVHSFDITPALRNTVHADGLAMFQRAAPPMVDGVMPTTEQLRALADAIAKITGGKAEFTAHDPSDDMFVFKNKEGKEVRVAGYAIGRIIRAAFGPAIKNTLNEEAFHFLENFLLDPKEIKVLAAAMKRGDWMGKYKIRRDYAGADEAQQGREARAHEFAQRMDDGFTDQPAELRSIWQKLREFLERVRNFFMGRGYQSADDVFRKIVSGEVGQREFRPGAVTMEESRLMEAAGHAGDIAAEFKLYPKIPTLEEAVEVIRKIPKAGERLGAIVDSAVNIFRMVQAWAAPMAAHGSADEARAFAKDWITLTNYIKYAYTETINKARREFTRDERRAMYHAVDADRLSWKRTGGPDLVKGVASLPDRQRDVVRAWEADATHAFWQGVAAGKFDRPPVRSYIPAMLVDIVGDEMKSFGTGGPGAVSKVADDILTLPFATMKLREVIAGATLVNKIAEAGRTTGQRIVRTGGGATEYRTMGTNIRTWTGGLMGRRGETIAETEALGERWRAARAAEDAAREGPEQGFTHIRNPSFYQWRATGQHDAETGDPIFARVPLEVRNDYVNPMKAVLHESSAGPHERGAVGLAKRTPEALYKALMSLKGKMMVSTLYGVGHLGVVMGRAIPATFEGKFPRVWGTMKAGKLGLQNPDIMRELIMNGHAPTNSHMGFQDVAGMLNDPQLKPGRSLTASVLAFVPGLFDPRAGEAVKRAVDAAGDLFHNKLLWGLVHQMQVGLALKMTDRLVAEGKGRIDRTNAMRSATEFANNMVGSLPREAMGQAARALANTIFFSRSYRFGSAAVWKMAIKGVSAGTYAQIKRDVGEDAANFVSKQARNMALHTVVMDVLLYYIMNSLIQSGLDTWHKLGQEQQELPEDATTLERVVAELKGYGRRTLAIPPLQALNPFAVFTNLQAMTPLVEHEPGKQNRILWNYDEDTGRGRYFRNITGKSVEDILDYYQQLNHTLQSTLSQYGRWTLESIKNDIGFGHPLYDVTSDHPMMQWAGHLATEMIRDTTPWLQRGVEWYQGKTEGWDALARLVLGGLGVSESFGHPEGPLGGEMAKLKQHQTYERMEQLPEIRRKIKNGDSEGAVKQMQDIGMTAQDMEYTFRQTMTPGGISKGQYKRFFETAPPELVKRLFPQLSP